LRFKHSILATHLLTSASTVGLYVATRSFAFSVPMALGCALVTGAAISIWGQRLFLNRLHYGMAQLESSISTGEPLAVEDDDEFRDWANSLRAQVQRWTDVATRSRQQLREVEAIIHILDRRTKTGRETSTGQLRSLLLSVAKQAQSTIQQVQDGSLEVARDAQSILQSTQQCAEAIRRSSTRSAKLSETLLALREEVSEGCRSLSSSREASAEIAGQASRLANEMSRIRSELKTGEAKLRVVNEQSDEITSSLSLISQLTSRTDMLALNASIESIRAGEHGRGFAAVADEIRKLAEQAGQAAENVADQLGLMQEGVRDAASVMAKERTGLDGFSANADSLRDGAEEIRRQAETTHNLFTVVLEKSERHAHAARELADNFEQFHDHGAQQTQRAEEVVWRTEATCEATAELITILRPLARLEHSDLPATSSDPSTAVAEELSEGHAHLADDSSSEALQTIG